MVTLSINGSANYSIWEAINFVGGGSDNMNGEGLIAAAIMTASRLFVNIDFDLSLVSHSLLL